LLGASKLAGASASTPFVDAMGVVVVDVVVVDEGGDVVVVVVEVLVVEVAGIPLIRGLTVTVITVVIVVVAVTLLVTVVTVVDGAGCVTTVVGGPPTLKGCMVADRVVPDVSGGLSPAGEIVPTVFEASSV
jgi:hypothetical protein